MSCRLSTRPHCLCYVFFIMLFMWFLYWATQCTGNKNKMVPKETIHKMQDSNHNEYTYHRDMPLVFIGGVPRSGTTLMRALLDAHPEVRCGEETRVIPRLLGMRSNWLKSTKESKRLAEAGITDEVIKDALAAFILEIIAKHGEPAPRLCNKDPFTAKSMTYLADMFPNSKYILMIRDGRAVVHSIMSRKVTITGFNLKSFRDCMQKWNSNIESMYYQCYKVGMNRCLPVYYEQLVLHPKLWMEQILKFLEIPWSDSVLHHEELINKPGGVSLSQVERSTDQVIKPINVEALSKWVEFVPDDVKRDMDIIAPMLRKLGYDPDGYPPRYGEPDRDVADNTKNVQRYDTYWKQKGQLVRNGPKNSILKDNSNRKNLPNSTIHDAFSSSNILLDTNKDNHDVS